MCKIAEIVSFQMLPNSENNVQNSENSQLPNASKCFQIAKTVQNSVAKTVYWSPALCHSTRYSGLISEWSYAAAQSPGLPSLGLRV